MGETEVTQKLWKAVMGNNPSKNKNCDECPVEKISWNDCQNFIKKLNEKTGKKYRLPTEAEWEYACRAGTTTPFHTGNNLTTEQANYDGNYPYNGNPKGISRKKTTPVKTFQANAWGLYDMHGNVWEWCNDWCGTSEEKNNPTSPYTSGSNRMMRGGSYFSHANYCKAAYRRYYSDSFKDYTTGLRLACTFP
jgi:formylglycine-generating enzyme required for sulfatase activity